MSRAARLVAPRFRARLLALLVDLPPREGPRALFELDVLRARFFAFACPVSPERLAVERIKTSPFFTARPWA
jgi:hypothetical protein